MTPSDLLPILASIILSGIAAGYLSRFALENVDPDASLPALKRYGFGVAGASLLSVASIAGPVPDSFPMMLAICAFGAIAGVLAIMDRDTAWAPDGLMLPVTLLAFAVGAMNYGTMPLLWSIPAGIAAFFAAQGFWWIQDRFEQRFLPPPDLLAFVIPAALLGLSFPLAIFYIVTAIMILILRQNPDLMPIFFRKHVLDEAAEDLGFQDKPAVTFLAVAFPVLAVIVFCDAIISH